MYDNNQPEITKCISGSRLSLLIKEFINMRSVTRRPAAARRTTPFGGRLTLASSCARHHKVSTTSLNGGAAFDRRAGYSRYREASVAGALMAHHTGVTNNSRLFTTHSAETKKAKTIVFTGGGAMLSYSLQALRKQEEPFNVIVFEKSPQLLAKGLAFGGPHPDHVTTTSYEDITGFKEWWPGQKKDPKYKDVQPEHLTNIVKRWVVGDFLDYQLGEVLSNPGQLDIDIRFEEVTGVDSHGGRVEKVITDQGTVVELDEFIVSCGSFGPIPLDVTPEKVVDNIYPFDDQGVSPLTEAMDEITRENPHKKVMVVGAGPAGREAVRYIGKYYPDVNVTWVCNPDEIRGVKFRFKVEILEVEDFFERPKSQERYNDISGAPTDLVVNCIGLNMDPRGTLLSNLFGWSTGEIPTGRKVMWNEKGTPYMNSPINHIISRHYGEGTLTGKMDNVRTLGSIKDGPRDTRLSPWIIEGVNETIKEMCREKEETVEEKSPSLKNVQARARGGGEEGQYDEGSGSVEINGVVYDFTPIDFVDPKERQFQAIIANTVATIISVLQPEPQVITRPSLLAQERGTILTERLEGPNSLQSLDEVRDTWKKKSKSKQVFDLN